MKVTMILTVSLAAAIVLFVAACQNQTGNTTGNSMSNMDHAMSSMNHNMSGMNHDMSNMNGHEMMNMNSDPGAADQPFDLQFLDSMIHHHNGAVIMAKMVLDKTERPELKAFAQKIIDDQTKEIDEMRRLREQLYSGKPSSVNMEMPGMVGGMKIMNSEHMDDMNEMEPSHFDNHFLNMMISHHEGAVTMSKEGEQKAEHPEIKQLAARILKAQTPEIEQMKKWKTAWNK
jgi:uncharacterized protein (DUF305 family)